MKEREEDQTEFSAWVNKEERIVTFQPLEGYEKVTFQSNDDTEGFFLAGIYRLESGIPVFSILTREPAESIAFIHNRMPVILPQIVMADWLNPRYNGSEVLSAAVTEMCCHCE